MLYSSFFDKPCLSMVIVDDQISGGSKIKTQPNESNQTSLNKNTGNGWLVSPIIRDQHWAPPSAIENAGKIKPWITQQVRPYPALTRFTVPCWWVPGPHCPPCWDCHLRQTWRPWQQSFQNKGAVVLTHGRNTKTQFSHNSIPNFTGKIRVCVYIYIQLYQPV